MNPQLIIRIVITVMILGVAWAAARLPLSTTDPNARIVANLLNANPSLRWWIVGTALAGAALLWILPAILS